MIKPIKITPLETTTYAYFHCINCGARQEISISMINTDNKHEMATLEGIQCPYCGKVLGKSGLPKMSTKEIIQLGESLFKGQSYPTPFYLDLLFNDRSPHSKSKQFSERFESLLQFLTNKGRQGLNDNATLGTIFLKTLQYFLSQGYLDEQEYKTEYDSCMKIWEKYFNKGGDHDMQEIIERALEGVAYASGHAGNRSNKNMLLKLKEMLENFLNKDFSEIGDFKGMIVFNHPEGPMPDNDVLWMDVQVHGEMLPLDNVLTDVWNEYYKTHS